MERPEFGAFFAILQAGRVRRGLRLQAGGEGLQEPGQTGAGRGDKSSQRKDIIRARKLAEEV